MIILQLLIYNNFCHFLAIRFLTAEAISLKQKRFSLVFRYSLDRDIEYRDFSPEDAGSMFLRKVDIHLHKFTWRYDPEVEHRHLHRRENLKSHILIAFFVNFLSISSQMPGWPHAIDHDLILDVYCFYRLLKGYKACNFKIKITLYEGDFLENSSNDVGFEVLTAVSTKMAVFWVVVTCSVIEVYQRFRGPCCLHYQDSSP
jgi:hypothetical protein